MSAKTRSVRSPLGIDLRVNRCMNTILVIRDFLLQESCFCELTTLLSKWVNFKSVNLEKCSEKVKLLEIRKFVIFIEKELV